MAEKKKIVMEFFIQSSLKVLYNFISTPSGLSEWFADDVKVRGASTFIFVWEGVEQEAKMVNEKLYQQVRFEWVEEENGDYFEFKIQVDEITSDVALIVTDFVEEGEEDEIELLWNSQIRKLMQKIGS